MSEEKKLYEFKDGKLFVSKDLELDPNKDGEALLKLSVSLELDVAEIPDEAIDFWKSRKEKKEDA